VAAVTHLPNADDAGDLLVLVALRVRIQQHLFAPR
jgi:hypothetical protein